MPLIKGGLGIVPGNGRMFAIMFASDSDRSPPDDGVRRRKKFLRPKAKSQTDLSRRSEDGDEDPPSLPPSPQPPSPYRKILGFRSGKKIHTVISTLRKFKLKHGRSKHYDSPEG
ncbi:uncharacterized protein TNCV_2305171 [Trichonephila clavipes]|nr:uncharacterized protein TNCV_2305171 [Trichonephila clavipes]